MGIVINIANRYRTKKNSFGPLQRRPALSNSADVLGDNTVDAEGEAAADGGLRSRLRAAILSLSRV
jgi:hypothetical protein